LIMAYSAATAFGKERDRSTLGFVLITPMSTSAIILGKLVGLLLPGGLAMMSILAINLALAIAVCLQAGTAAALPGVLFTSCIPVLLSLTGAMVGILSASLLRKETDAGSLALFTTFSFIGVVFYVDFSVGGMQGYSVGIEATAFWVLCLAVLTAVISLVCGALTYARVETMRRGDITFGPGGKR